jgi:uncharacterized membrane-anchored protein
MSTALIIKAVIILLLLAIIGSLTMALIRFVQDKGQSERTVKALTVRVCLSIFLFLLVLVAILFDLIKPNTMT